MLQPYSTKTVLSAKFPVLSQFFPSFIVLVLVLLSITKTSAHQTNDI